MSKKKSASSAKAAAVDENAVTRQMVLANYAKLCKCVRCCRVCRFALRLLTLGCLRLIGVPVNTHVNDVLRGSSEEEEELVNACDGVAVLAWINLGSLVSLFSSTTATQFILEADPPGPLGPGGMRALCMALLISSHRDLFFFLPSRCILRT